MSGGRISSNRYQVADYNGDGLPDIISADGWWLPNIGGRFERARVLPQPVDTTWTDVSVEEAGAQNYRGYSQVVLDATGDGRPDILRLLQAAQSGGPVTQMYLYTDTNRNSAPGRLRMVNNGRGASWEFEYRPISAVLETGDRGIPAHSWVVTKVTQRANTTDPRPQVTTYRYRGPQYRPDPAVQLDATGAASLVVLKSEFRGFASVVACLPNGSADLSEFTYDPAQHLDGVLTRHEVKRSCTSTEPLHVDVYNYGSTVTTDSVGGGRVVRNRVSTSSHLDYEYPQGGCISALPGPPSIRSKRLTYTYYGEHVLPTTIRTEVLNAYDVVVDRLTSVESVEYASHDDLTNENYGIVPVASWVGPDANVASALRRKSFIYDDFNAVGQFGRGNLTTTIEYDDASDMMGRRTHLERDGVGHVWRVTTPAGLQSQSCWDSYALYPVAQRRPNGLTIRRAYSYVTGDVLEESGPTQVPALGASCPAFRTDVSFGERLPLSQLENLTSTTETPSPEYVGSIDGLPVAVPAADARRYESPFFAGHREYAPAVSEGAEAPVAKRTFTGLPCFIHRPAMVPIPPLANPYPAPPTAPSVRWLYDARGRPLQADATERDSSCLQTAPPEQQAFCPLYFMQLGFNTYAPDGRSSVTHTRVLDDLNMTSDSSFFDGLQRLVRHEQWDANSNPIGSRYYYNASGAPWYSATPSPDYEDPVGTLVYNITDRDQSDRPVCITQPDGTTISVMYSDRREDASSTEPGARTIVADHQRRVVSIRDYDGLGRLAEERRDTNASGVASALRTKYRWDAAGQLIARVEPDGSAVEIGYNQRGLRREVRRYTADSSTHAYSPAESWSYVYLADGRLDYELGPAGRTTYHYDAFGRLSRVEKPPVNGLPGYGDVQYRYQDNPSLDGAGQISNVISPTEQTDYAYNERDEVVHESRTVAAVFGGNNFIRKYEFDYRYGRSGQVVETTSALVGCCSRTMHYDYDTRGDLSRIWDDVGGSPRDLARFTYTAMDQLRLRTDAWQGSDQTWYDRMGRVRRVRVDDGLGTLWTQTIGRTTNGRGLPATVTTQWRDGYQQALSASYDQADRLVSATDPEAYALTMNFQPADPLAAPAQPQSVVEQLPDGTSRSATYGYARRAPGAPASDPVDPAAVTSLTRSDGTTLLSQQYDATGAVTVRTTASGGSHVLHVDPDGLLRADGANVYLYDTAGLRTHAYRAGDGGQPGAVTATVGGLLRVQYSENSEGFSVAAIEFLAGLGPTPLARVGQDASDVTLMHRDAVSNVALVRRATGTPSGTDWAAFAYSPYGEVLRSRGTDLERELWRYQGGVIDPAGSDFVQFGWRRYDPQTRRWASQDPALWSKPYDFVAANPLVFDDPWGLDEGGGWGPVQSCGEACTYQNGAWGGVGDGSTHSDASVAGGEFPAGGVTPLPAPSAPPAWSSPIYGVAAATREALPTALPLAGVATLALGLHLGFDALAATAAVDAGLAMGASAVTRALRFWSPAGSTWATARAVQAISLEVAGTRAAAALGGAGAVMMAMSGRAAGGGGGASGPGASPSASSPTIRFGGNPNQVHHAFRHVDAAGLSRSAVQGAVESHLRSVVSRVVSGQPFNQIIEVAGQRIQYTAYRLADGVINVGRIHPVP